MKFLIVFVALIVAIMAQKPFYAGSAVPYPGLASRFQNRDSDTNTNSSNTTVTNDNNIQPQVGGAAGVPGTSEAGLPAGGGIDLGNRIGNTDNQAVQPSTLVPTTTRTTTTERIPIDALGDVDLVNRIKTWPREKQPFWFINAQHIEATRNRTVQQVPTIQSRGSFIPSSF